MEKKFTIGTHNGIFHSDEIVACGILKILFKNVKEVEIIRSRDIKLLNEKCNILVDIGGGKFDHHQKGGNGKRNNNVSYASAGLVWKEFGELLINKLNNSCLTPKGSKKVFDIIDNEIIEKVDKEDNGEKIEYHPFQFIQYYLPSWKESSPNYDDAFKKALDCTTEIISNYCNSVINKEFGNKEIKKRIASSETRYNNILLIPSQTINWTEIIIKYNLLNNASPIDFVIFPYPAGGYALQCVPPSLENKFGQRIKLPNNWSGETTQLAQITGVKSATFCHKGCFFARANKLNDAIKLCMIATKINQEKNILIKKP